LLRLGGGASTATGAGLIAGMAVPVERQTPGYFILFFV
jgi:hypothetical protein